MSGVDSLILVTGILLLAGIASNRFSARMNMPVLVLFLLVGMLAGSEGIGGLEFEDYALASGIGTVALCLILFDGGLRTPYHSVRAAWKPAVVLATGGVLITAVITGLAAAWILKLGILEGLLLGSIVGSTDASAVFSVLRTGGVSIRRRLSDTLEIESGSNDPMAIFLTVGLLQVLTNAVPIGPGLLGLFLMQLGLGTVVGLAVGFAGVWTLRNVRLGAAGLYPVLATSLAFLSFGLAALLGGSGFLAVYLTGMVIGNRRPVFHRGILLFHDAAAWIGQILMFITLGLLSFPSRLIDAAGPALLIAAVLILIARPVAVFLSTWPFRFSIPERLFLSWVGLKGAVPITLATFPMLAGLEGASLMFDTVFFVVLVSAIIQGWTLPLAARKLKLDEIARRTPPVTLEISSLQHVDGDIVDYYVDPGCRAEGRLVKDLALPDDVVVALIVRGDGIIPPQGRTRILTGDHIVVVLRPTVRAMVDRVFAHSRDEQPASLPTGLEFPLRGSIRVRELEQFYDLKLGDDPDLTLDELVRLRLTGERLREGAVIPFRQISFRVRQLAADNTVEFLGMTILPLPPEDASAVPPPPTGTDEAPPQKQSDQTP